MSLTSLDEFFSDYPNCSRYCHNLENMASIVVKIVI
jgi:hypothetical protein